MRRALLNLLLLAVTCSVAIGFSSATSTEPASYLSVPVQPGVVTTNTSNGIETTAATDVTTAVSTNATTPEPTPIPTNTTMPITTPNITTPAPTLSPTPSQIPNTTSNPNLTTTPTPSPSLFSTTKPTTVPGSITTSVPPTQAPSKGRHFDGLSFMGGIILTACLVGLSVGSYKFYKIKTERSYRTL